MRFIVIFMVICLLVLDNVNSISRCTCICCRGPDCSPVKQRPFNVESCDVDGKCDAFCCQHYPKVCFPLPGPGFIDSTCQNLTMHNLK